MLYDSKICDKAVNTYHSTIKFIPECFTTKEMCDKAVNRCFLVFHFIPDWYKTQEMCNRVVYEDPVLIHSLPQIAVSSSTCVPGCPQAAVSGSGIIIA